MFRKRLKWIDFVHLAMIRLLTIPLIVIYLTNLITAECIYPPCNVTEIHGHNSCPDLITVYSSLLIKHLEEGVEHKEILHVKYGPCDLSIVMQDPDDMDYVKIDPKTNMLTSIALDRESKTFSGMLVPQIQVHLELDCKDGNRNAATNYFEAIDDLIPDHETRYTHPTRYNNRSYVLTSDIGFSPGKVMLSIIIEDTNDNKPQFMYPPSTNFQIGYPDPAISEEIFSDYLLKVVARDNDAGQNALIRYKMHPEEDFRINPVTGEIFPTTSAMQYTDKLSLTVTATDRDGAEDGQKSSIDIIVKKVSAKHIVLLTVERKTPGEVYKAIKALRKSTGVDFRIFRKGFVSTTPSKFANESTNIKPTVMMKAWIFAFDANEDLLNSTVIVEKLTGKDNGILLVAYKGIKKSSENHDNGIKQDDNYFIIIVVTVGLSSAIAVIIVVGIIYWFLNRRNKYRRMSTPSVTDTTISTISGDVDHHHKHIYQKRESISHKKSSILKRSSLPESTEDLERFARKMHHILGDISEGSSYTPDMDFVRPSEKRKSSVTFNDEVKCININEDNQVEETITVRL